MRTRLLLDTIDIDCIKKYSQFVDGVTTNPTMYKRFGITEDTEFDLIKELQSMVSEIHVEAFGETKDEIIANGIRFQAIPYNTLVLKIPFSLAGLKAVPALRKVGFRTNLHLVFSLNQIALAAKSKADYVCTLVGRLDDEGHDGMNYALEAQRMLEGSDTKLMVSSVRHPRHVIQGLKFGADSITIPPDVMDKMFIHKLTTDGIERFKKDMHGF